MPWHDNYQVTHTVAVRALRSGARHLAMAASGMFYKQANTRPPPLASNGPSNKQKLRRAEANGKATLL